DKKDSCTIEYAAAYGLKKIKKLERTFEFTRTESDKPNSLTVIDVVEFEQTATFETALLTYESWEKQSNSSNQVDENKIDLLIGAKDKKIRVVVTATVDGKSLPLKLETIEIDEDALAKKKPTRLSFKIEKPITNAKIITEITPQN
ncbi:MAG: hypothetical protein LBK06_11135, partial [Planctomycetaceae bacterium]|nr:hypothetical protein [Planctomycetaceae bacterium]